ncbi:hypothetical protein GCM10029976_044210 [Kribbella albertanoniae]|uniref:Uncharacterized protein n=1 Tax=Kribbella albertanoniae TaxID=1266829 RepID=A0A4R4PN31_9ACTN|nr:hypothetical protein [Kribbella albertanoniae]TDC23433.1 hypothetical protein E1261_28420 [Kribbella albertanoniae]
MPKLKLGVAFYALAALLGAWQIVRAVRHEGEWQESHGWVHGAMVAVLVLTVGLLAVGAVTRWGLISDGGPWICENGWIVLIVLAAVAFGLALLQDGGETFPVGPVVFLPHFIRKLQENYYAGQQEASAAKRPATPESVE